jgi:hypothetical protein
MLAAGSLEVIATTCLHHNMRHSPHKLLRRSTPLAPLLLTKIHFIEGSRNLPAEKPVLLRVPGLRPGWQPLCATTVHTNRFNRQGEECQLGKPYEQPILAHKITAHWVQARHFQ